MGRKHAVGGSDSDGGKWRGIMMRGKYMAIEERARAEDKMEKNRDGAHLDSITRWREYDLTRSPTERKKWIHI